MILRNYAGRAILVELISIDVLKASPPGGQRMVISSFNYKKR